ncbi:cytochrome c biogenesis CcdA family protein [Gordonia sp. (in: high G+C Gram-positive bacteria)]|uniref:cytochrome c biogenesis CcdA family protein n=1 Tax=Gordonia sp. (in: high G+C Gram-positive bacteria) TaxID=84139 RepID=UPI0016A2CA27|nr:cytochrome c biogenesis CcdA family protein [Gordonia sp. (in: high G+C Gram-positive bacteria)]NLG45533.1 cytochrome c biogenesis protein CcdA [Gordonia sp. (in: high G+C Gram-positive bacteria)]
MTQVYLADLGTTFASTVTSGPLLLALGVCVLVGLISFASPCVVPLVPGYLSYLAGLVGAEAPAVQAGEGAKSGRWRVVGAAGLFVLGFTVIYVLATAALFGVTSVFLDTDRLELMQRIGGVITIIMGLIFLGMIPFLQRDVRMAPRRYSGLIGAPILGAVFAIGWIPCSSATLGAVLGIAMSTEGNSPLRGALMVTAYCLGLGIPFLLLALSSAWAVRSLGFVRRHARTIQIIGGVLLIGVGVMLVTGMWNEFVDWIRITLINDVELPV